jgi:hypothetical protein
MESSASEKRLRSNLNSETGVAERRDTYPREEDTSNDRPERDGNPAIKQIRGGVWPNQSTMEASAVVGLSECGISH